jgi:hypothetical protein
MKKINRKAKRFLLSATWHTHCRGSIVSLHRIPAEPHDCRCSYGFQLGSVVTNSLRLNARNCKTSGE